VTERDAECVGESHRQQRFRGAVIADEQQRLFGGEVGEERGLEGVVAADVKGRITVDLAAVEIFA
jgi:hypothetical protein